MSRSITSSTRLDVLKKAAKRWLRELRAGDTAAWARYDAAYAGKGRPPQPLLREVQHALAREHGVATWPALRTALDDLVLASRSAAERADELLELASLHYGVAPGSRAYTGYPDGEARRRRAARILERHPEVARHSLHTAVVCGDRDEVARRLAQHSNQAREPGGREAWQPLLFLCYSRLPIAAAHDNALPIATLLLEHGADPNCGWSYDWDGQTMHFSALCGVIGDGEKGPVICPAHPRADELARLLLQRGASPDQPQALYNTMLRGDDDHWLAVLIDHGLQPHAPLPWLDDGQPTTLVDYLLARAVITGQLARARRLLRHGARATPAHGRSLYERALLSGSREMAELLAQHGAARSELTGSDAFRATCAGLDATTARSMLAHDSSLMAEACALLAGEVARADLVDVARLLLDLSASPDAEIEGPMGRYRALHQAGCANAVRVAALLIERGADVDARDASIAATPLAWALHVNLEAAIELLARHTCDVFTLAAGACTQRLRTRLEADPAQANAKTDRRIGLGRIAAEPGETPLFVLPEDEELAFEVAGILVAFGADPSLRNREGQTPADRAHARGLHELGEWLSTPETPRAPA